MSAPADISLDGSTLARPSTFLIKYGKRSVTRIMADGSLQEAVMNNTAKRVFTMGWQKLTASQKTTLESKYAALFGTSLTFVDIHGTSYTVTNDEGQEEIEFEIFVSANEIYYRTQLRLREV